MTSTLNNHPRNVEVTDQSPGYNLPQKMGRRLWAPMWVMALMGFGIGFILAIVRADAVATGASEVTVARLDQLVPAFMFIGFMAVFAAVSFAIARVLGVFRKGGGDLQVAAGRKVQTLAMPVTAKLFMATMMMGMMAILVAVIIHLVIAVQIDSGSDFLAVEQSAVWLEGMRRTGAALFLFGITFGLGTIITVLRFQADRIGQLPTE